MDNIDKRLQKICRYNKTQQILKKQLQKYNIAVKHLDAIRNSLNSVERTVFELRYQKKLSVTQIAMITNYSERQVYRILDKLKRKIKNIIISKNEIDCQADINKN